MKTVALSLAACVLSAAVTAEAGLLRSRCSCRGTTAATAPTAPAIGQGAATPTPVPAAREEQAENTKAPKFRDLRVSDGYEADSSNTAGTTAAQPAPQTGAAPQSSGWSYAPTTISPRSSSGARSSDFNAGRKILNGGVAR